jgi:hypothetical protein
MITIPRMPLSASKRRSIGSLQATIAGALNGDSSVIDRFDPKTHRPLICAYGLPVDEYAPTAASTTAESRSALVASPGLAVWTAPSASLKALATAGPS